MGTQKDHLNETNVLSAPKQMDKLMDKRILQMLFVLNPELYSSKKRGLKVIKISCSTKLSMNYAHLC